jgi:hypothetical protein
MAFVIGIHFPMEDYTALLVIRVLLVILARQALRAILVLLVQREPLEEMELQ